MKYFVAIVFAALAIAFVSAEGGTPTKFTTKFDDVNLDEILKSDRLLQNYFDCLMDTKPCTPGGTELKSKFFFVFFFPYLIFYCCLVLNDIKDTTKLTRILHRVCFTI